MRIPSLLPLVLLLGAACGPARQAPQGAATGAYDVAGRRVIGRWLNNRTARPRHKNRTCPELDDLTVTSWSRRLADEFLALLAVLEGCARIEGSQRELLNQVCEAPTITIDDLNRSIVGPAIAGRSKIRRSRDTNSPALFPA